MKRPHTRIPMTYVHDGQLHLDDPEPTLELVKPAPPDIYHLSPADTTIMSGHGPAYPVDGDPDHMDSSEEVQARFDKACAWADAMHATGVKWLIPYICNQTLVGNPDRRTGVWMFWDHWDEYTEFGVGERPETDPIEWMARERDGRLHYNYELRHTAFTPNDQFHYAPCQNNPGYQQFLKAVVVGIARCGYDGVFVDNNNLNCYCEYCRSGFRERMTGMYTPEQLHDFFGWDTPEEIEAGWRGNRFAWLQQDEFFRGYVDRTLSSEDKVRWFGTDDMAKADLAEPGNGWLWGRGNEYVTWLHANISPDDRHRMWGFEHLENCWGIRDDRDRRTWAETKRFWAESNSRNHELIKQWGSGENGRQFVVVPNWGNMQNGEDVEFRLPIGHDVKRWLPFMDMLFWEDDGEPGRIAPGLYLDFALEYRFALSHGVRSGNMANLPGDEATADVAHAEVSASGGSAFIQRMPEFPELRNAYTRLYREFGDWYDDYESAARVGLIFSIENLHMENNEHAREAYRLNHWLCDQGVPHDLLIERQVRERDILSGYDVVIAPRLRYIRDRECAALVEFVRNGGTLVVTGDTGTHNILGVGREENPILGMAANAMEYDGYSIYERGGVVIFTDSLDRLLPLGHVTREDAYEIATGNQRLVKREYLRAELLHAGDYAANVERFQDGGLLAQVISGWDQQRYVDPYACCGLRPVPYQRYDGDSGVIVTHLVNYNLDLWKPAGTRVVESIKNAEIRIPVRDGWHVTSAEWLEPGGDPTPIACETENGTAVVTIAEVHTYGMIRLNVEQA
jgi:glycosyl hydrolase family 42 (putative beta-galactosidase)